MAAREQKPLIEPKTVVGSLMTLGALWGALWLVGNAPSRSGKAIGLIVLMIVAAVIAYPIVQWRLRASALQALLQRTRAKTDQQLEPLLRRGAQLVRLDPYGKPQHDKWAKEIDYFVSQHIQPFLTAREQAALKRNYPEVAQIIRDRVEEAQRDQPAFQTFSDNMTPAEFETFCAEELRRAGWDARVTMQSRDQGVDVIAEKVGRRVVLQCKLYAHTVGNKSVQEATAARAHEQANFGIVVSNNRYTDAAEQLAATNGVLLLHYRDLQNLDEILSQRRGALNLAMEQAKRCART